MMFVDKLLEDVASRSYTFRGRDEAAESLRPSLDAPDDASSHSQPQAVIEPDPGDICKPEREEE
jgi:hypothetical protein